MPTRMAGCEDEVEINGKAGRPRKRKENGSPELVLLPCSAGGSWSADLGSGLSGLSTLALGPPASMQGFRLRGHAAMDF